MKMVDYLLIVDGVCVILFCAVQIARIVMRGVHSGRIYFTDEWYKAHCQLDIWAEEGKLPAMTWIEQYRHLRVLCGCWNIKRARQRLQMLSGPNGWVVYQMLLKQRNWWSKLIS